MIDTWFINYIRNQNLNYMYTISRLSFAQRTITANMQRTSLLRKRRKSLKDMKTGPNLYSFTWLIWQCTVLIRTTLCKFQPLSSGNSITSKTYGVESLQECSIKYLNHLLNFSYLSTRNVQNRFVVVVWQLFFSSHLYIEKSHFAWKNSRLLGKACINSIIVFG